MRPAVLFLVALGLLAAPAVAAVTPWQDHEVVALRLLAPWRTAPAEGPLELGLHFRLAPGWHVYWKNSGDAGFPPQVAASGTPPVGAATILYPAPERYDLPGGLVAFGYADEVVYPLRLDRPQGGVTGGTQRLAVEVDYLACEEDCIPFRDTFALELPLGAPAPDGEAAPLLARWRQRLPRAAAEAGVAAAGRLEPAADGARLTLALRGLGDGAPELFLEPFGEWLAGLPTHRRADGEDLFTVPLTAATSGTSLPAALPVRWTVAGAVAPVSGELTARPLAAALLEEPAAAPAVVTLAPFTEGFLLALSPPALAVLLLLALGQHRRERRRLGAESLVWPALGGAAAGLVLLATASRLLAGWSGLATPFADPLALGLLALGPLAFALACWLAPERLVLSADGGGRAAAWAAAGALLALPWAPLLSEAAAAAVGLTSLPELALAAGGFGLAFAFAALVGATDEVRDQPRLGPRGAVALGFLPLLSLVWISYRLLETLPSPDLAFVQLSWLGLGLAARLAIGGRTLGRLLAAAVGIASLAALLWVSGAGSPTGLS